jgi:hypothetical protein
LILSETDAFRADISLPDLMFIRMDIILPIGPPNFSCHARSCPKLVPFRAAFSRSNPMFVETGIHSPTPSAKFHFTPDTSTFDTVSDDDCKTCTFFSDKANRVLLLQ